MKYHDLLRLKMKKSRASGSKQITVTFWLVLMLSIALIAIVAVQREYRNNLRAPVTAGVFGDFLSGTLGPLLSLVSIYFVVLTLREQRKTTLDERRAEEIDGFENRFYRMIDMHRANVREMSLQPLIRGNDPIRGKRVFLMILAELQTAMIVVREQNTHLGLNLSAVHELQVAYYCVFFGIGNNSLIPLYKALRSNGVLLGPADLVFIEKALESSRTPNDSYYKFDGHQVRLGHYYRHLFQAVAFAHGQTVISDKQSYLKTLRAQLSTHEQMLLLVNSLTPLGWKWLSNGFIKEYGLVKNIPAGMLERYCGISVGSMFGNDYWEYQEKNHRPNDLDQVKRVGIIEPTSQKYQAGSIEE